MHSRKLRRPTPWFTDDIQKKIKDKNHAKCLFERTGNLDDRLVFRKLKNDLKHTIRQAKLDFLQSALSQSKSNPLRAAYMWSCVNNIIGCFKAHKLISEEISLDSINCYFNSAALTPLIRVQSHLSYPLLIILMMCFYSVKSPPLQCYAILNHLTPKSL